MHRGTFALAAVLLAGCSAAPSSIPTPRGHSSEPNGSGDDSSGTPSPSGSNGDGTLTQGSDAGNSDGCSDAARLVYVVTHDDGLYSFAPADMAFKQVGTLTCQATAGAFPYSMAVDRGGTAWVLYTDGNLFKVSTADASCAATNFVPDQGGFHNFGMGFAADAAGGTSESLYASDLGGKGLAKVDLATMTLAPLGAYTGALAGDTSELTGTGDGKLYGFFTTSPTQLAQISKGSGSIDSSITLDQIHAGTDWAIAFWGGDFYFFNGNSTIEPALQPGSNVVKYRPSTGEVVQMSPGIGFLVTGAGVSTCAPVTEPPPR